MRRGMGFSLRRLILLDLWGHRTVQEVDGIGGGIGRMSLMGRFKGRMGYVCDDSNSDCLCYSPS